MKNINEISEKTKLRIIQILEQDGVDKDSVQACAMGLATENIGVDSYQKSYERASELFANHIQNNREYVEQVLTIYGEFAASQMKLELYDIFGVDHTHPVFSEMEAKSAEIVANAVREFTPKFVLQ